VSVTTVNPPVSSLPTGTAISTTPGDGGLVQVVQLSSANVTALQPLATQPVSDGGGSLTVDGPLTDTELRATPVPVSGTVTITDGSGAVSVDDNGGSLSIDDNGGSITVDGSVSVSNFPATQPVTDNGGSLTIDSAQLPAALSGSTALKVTQVDRAPTMGSGLSAAPAASAVIADTGALAAGNYRIEWNCAALDTVAVGKGMIVEYRNAANSATTQRLGGCVAGATNSGSMSRLTVALNERVRIIAGTAAGAASSQYVAFIAAFPVD
jgi:hypothetical protein